MTKSYAFRADALTTVAAASLALAATMATVTSVKAETATDGFRQTVEADIARQIREPGADLRAAGGIATVAVRIDAQGRVLSTGLLRSSGTRAYDAEALRTARTVRYPATGKPRTVAMVLGFNRTVTPQAVRTAQRLADASPTNKPGQTVRLAETVSAQPDS